MSVARRLALSGSAAIWSHGGWRWSKQGFRSAYCVRQSCCEESNGLDQLRPLVNEVQEEELLNRVVKLWLTYLEEDTGTFRNSHGPTKCHVVGREMLRMSPGQKNMAEASWISSKTPAGSRATRSTAIVWQIYHCGRNVKTCDTTANRDLTRNTLLILKIYHVIQPSGSRTSRRDQCFFCFVHIFVEFCYSLGFGTTGVSGNSCDSVGSLVIASIQTVVIRCAHAFFTVLQSCSRVCPVLYLLSQLQLLWARYTGVTFLSWRNYVDHSGSGASTVGGRAQRSLRRWTLVLTMMSSRQWMPNREDQNDPPPEFTVTKPSEFKSYRKKVKLWLLLTRTRAQLQGPRVLSRLTGPACDACDGLEPEDVATDDGVEVILDTLAEAFQGEHETELFDVLETPSVGLAGKKVRDSMSVHFGYKATYGSWPSKEYGCQTKYRVSSVSPSEPEFSGSHRHHDIGR